VITYGQNPQADVRILNFINKNGGCEFDVELRDRLSGEQKNLNNIYLPMPGLHNALNATAAIAVVDQLEVGADAIRKGLFEFSGVKRRFSKTGEVDGVVIIDDYGHHPVEISYVLEAARQSAKNHVIAVMQPHRYTRLSELFEEFAACFNDADTVIVAPVFTAGEEAIEGVNHRELARRIRALGHRDVRTIDDPKMLAPLISERATKGDYVVCLGAGNITQWAQKLPGELIQLKNGA